MDLATIITAIHPIPTCSLAQLVDNIQEVAFPKGHVLLHPKVFATNIYFVKKGIVRAYASTRDTDRTFWFGKEGDVVFSITNYVKNTKSYETIELLEDCIFYQLPHTTLQQLYEQDIHIANWGRKLAEFEMIKAEQRVIQLQQQTATERYQELLTKHPELIQRIQLSHIASYLGITQVSLSRIRSEISF